MQYVCVYMYLYIMYTTQNQSAFSYPQNSVKAPNPVAQSLFGISRILCRGGYGYLVLLRQSSDRSLPLSLSI